MKEKIMLGEFIYNRRKILQMSQAELGEIVGVSNKAVSKWETDEANPDMQLIKPLAAALKCSVEELLSCKMNAEKESEYKSAKVFGVSGVLKNNSEEYEFISNKLNSKREPFLHIHFGKKLSALNKRARGTIAIGLFAHGTFSFGLVSSGVFAFGLLAFGWFAFAPLALSMLLSVGSIALGFGVSVGALAVGSVAVGALAVGIVSVGALSIGVYAYSGGTGLAIGLHTHMFALKTGIFLTL